MSEEFTLDYVIREHVKKMLVRCHGNRDQVAREMGVGKTTVYRWVKKWNLIVPRRTPSADLLAEIDAKIAQTIKIREGQCPGAHGEKCICFLCNELQSLNAERDRVLSSAASIAGVTRSVW